MSCVIESSREFDASMVEPGLNRNINVETQLRLLHCFTDVVILTQFHHGCLTANSGRRIRTALLLSLLLIQVCLILLIHLFVGY